MPRPRTPLAKHKLKGSHIIHPERFRDRAEPKAEQLGNAPEWFNSDELVTWHQFVYEIPWLNASHRTILEIASQLRTKMMNRQKVSVKDYSELRACLIQMGATPAAATKVSVPDDGDKEPEAEFFN